MSQHYLLVMLMHQKQWQEEGNCTKRGSRQSQHPMSECVCFVYAHVDMVSMCACVFLALTFVDIECDGADCDADHAFRVVEKLNGLGVQGKVISVLCVGDKRWGVGEQGTALQHRPQATNDHRERRRKLSEMTV